ncbi:MAG: carboxypeptidase regulatory-like domain-containing protein [Planctomycetota bacterium JB042]
MSRPARWIALLLIVALAAVVLRFLDSEPSSAPETAPPDLSTVERPRPPDAPADPDAGPASRDGLPEGLPEREADSGGAGAGSAEASPNDVVGTGKVVDENGAPIGGATVRALLHRQAFVTVHEPLGVEALSDGTGAFRLEGLPRSVAVALLVERSGRARATVGPIQTAREGSFRLPTVTLGPGLRLVGAVRDETDLRPVAEAIVTVSPDRPEAGRMLFQGAPDVLALTGRTDAAGRFSIEGLDYTHYRIEASSEGYAPAVVRRSFIASRGRDEIELSLTLTPSNAELRGVVLGDDRPVAGAIVRAVVPPGGADAHSATARTAADGTFTLRGLTVEAYELTARANGYFAREPVLATPGPDAEVRIELGRTGSLSGRVIAGDGAAPESFSAKVLRVEGARGTTRAVRRALPGESPGTFRATDLPPGRYVVEVDAGTAARTRSDPVEIGEAEDADGVVVRLAAGGSVRGRVVDAEGAPVAGVTAHLLPPDFDASSPVAEVLVLEPHLGRSARTDGDGRFELAHVAAGRYGVRLLGADGGAGFVPGIDVEEGEVADVGDVELAGAGRLSGVALDVDGRPLPRARVIAVSEGTASRRSRLTDSEGRFDLGPVPAGAYVVHVEAADRWRSFEFTSDTPANVPEGGAVEVTVRVRRR